ncbi:7-cyano-7-deazaguanine synthase [Nitrosomonas nitrosa]|uniref:7-cyano-7-deazaguanine synthase n=1 Tax=Nitrosomonas nitrosa TaxID=52442 RepID=A0A1I4TI03_9PROT|nr:7-cyano-7-deazaguanine synthase [Nitrosomonas nitrosa]SFM76291.1 7-cyano-7-deazaguanine synthase [Nitrosomonas nitrosa]
MFTEQLSKEALVLLSGGIDSMSCVHFLKCQNYSVKGIFVNYGQASFEYELCAVKKIQTHFEIDVDHVSIKSDKNIGSGELAGRNALLISTAILYGNINRGLIVIGVHAGTPYYDCSEGFIERMKKVTEEYFHGLVTLSAPFLSWDKATIYKYFCDQNLPVNITYSCESGTLPPCGVCASCLDRSKFGC